MKIKAKFKGADGSLGYRNGENYSLNFGTRLTQCLTREAIVVSPEVHTKSQTPIVYESLKSFLNNWQIL